MNEEFKVVGKKFQHVSEVVAVDAKGVAGGIGILWNLREVALTNFMTSRLSLLVSCQILGTRT